MIRNLLYLVVAVAMLAWTSVASAQTVSITSAAMRSSGSNKLTDIGYVGSYIKIPPGGATVNFKVNANHGTGTGAGPHLNLVIADTKFGINVASTSKIDYGTGNVTLPEGMYAVRVERDYANNASSTRSATINKISMTTVAGGKATFSNSNSNSNALAAANTYIQNFRKGSASVRIEGLAPGTPVQVRMTRNAFNFGVSIAGTERGDPHAFAWDGSYTDPIRTTYLSKLTATVPGTSVKFFNTISTEDAGKWLYQERLHKGPEWYSFDYINDIFNVAEQNDMRVRLTPLMWDFPQQQPGWVNDLIGRTLQGDPFARSDLTKAIWDRIQYYVKDRAGRYDELDVLNEALRTPNFWRIYGPLGTAFFYNEVAAAAAAAGKPGLRAFTNEYNVLQNSNDPLTRKSDPYANWYSIKEIAAIRNWGGTVGGIGMQYYAIKGGSSPHSTARIMQVLQNLSTHGLPIGLNEFGVQGGAGNRTIAATYLEETMRMMFGSPEATNFLSWGFWEGHVWAPSAASVLYDLNWNLTPAGVKWQQMMQLFSTTLDNVLVDANGMLNFNGFYGDYDVIVGGQVYDLSLVKGTNLYTLSQPQLENLALGAPESLAMESLATNVPEPSALALLSAAAGVLLLARLRKPSPRVACSRAA